MINRDPAAQICGTVLMIRPARFESNPQTATSNAFQAEPGDPHGAGAQARALAEFEAVAGALREAGVEVLVFEDTLEPHTPDAVFPNNWASFHADGAVVLYPMLAPNRRAERRTDILESLSRDHGFHIRDVIDLAYHERDGRFLEGTGSLVLDRAHRIAYACLSPRTHLDVLAEFGQRMGFEIVAFGAADQRGQAVYHTNVMMCIGPDFAVLCADAISEPGQREAVLERLRVTGHEIIRISHEQMGAFAGNMLCLESGAGERLLVMSRQARASLLEQQIKTLARHAGIVAVAVDHIEHIGGGGIRCMLAEVFLPR